MRTLLVSVFFSGSCVLLVTAAEAQPVANLPLTCSTASAIGQPQNNCGGAAESLEIVLSERCADRYCRDGTNQRPRVEPTQIGINRRIRVNFIRSMTCSRSS